MAEWKARRFWKAATVGRAADGFEVLLDGRRVRTPAKAPFVLPTEAMAQAAADEWQTQRDEVDPLTMPVTRAANAALDKVVHQFDEVAGLVAAYGDADLTCYRAESPQGLAARQAAGWDPLLGWAARTFGARLVPVAGLIHRPQPAEGLAALDARVRACSAFELTALHDLVSLSGSLVIGLAVIEGFDSADALWPLSRIDEDWQIEEWGEDDEATEAATAKRAAFVAAERFFRLAQG